MVASIISAIESLSFVMMESDDMDALAAEYVLGTLPAGERAAVSVRRTREANVDEAITTWEALLKSLASALAT